MVLEPVASQGLTDLVLIGPCVHVLLDSGGILLYDVPGESASTIANVLWIVPATIITAGHPARMLVVKMQSVRRGTMGPSAHAPLDLWETL